MGVSLFGLHGPDRDEDLSFRGLLAGDYGQNQKQGPSKRVAIPDRECSEKA